MGSPEAAPGQSEPESPPGRDSDGSPPGRRGSFGAGRPPPAARPTSGPGAVALPLPGRGLKGQVSARVVLFSDWEVSPRRGREVGRP